MQGRGAACTLRHPALPTIIRAGGEPEAVAPVQRYDESAPASDRMKQWELRQ